MGPGGWPASGASHQKGRVASPSGNRTPVSRVTGGDTHHYTNEDGGHRPATARPPGPSPAACRRLPLPAALGPRPTMGPPARARAPPRRQSTPRPPKKQTATRTAARGPNLPPPHPRPYLALQTPGERCLVPPPWAREGKPGCEVAAGARLATSRPGRGQRRGRGPPPEAGWVRGQGCATGRPRRRKLCSTTAGVRPAPAHPDARPARSTASAQGRRTWRRVGSQPAERRRAPARRQDGRAV